MWARWAVVGCCLVLAALAWTAASADASTVVDERPDAVLVSPADVEGIAGAPAGRDHVLLDGDAPRLEEGDPVLVPISPAAPEGVLGIVTHVREIDHGQTTIETRPAPLSRVYSEIEVKNRTLAELTPRPSAIALLAQQFDCTGSGKVEGTQVKPDLESLKLDLHIDLPRREFRVVLAGQPKIDVTVSASGEARCRYTGHAGIPIVIPGTPILLKISPAASIETSGAFKTSFSWGPEIAVGIDKPRYQSARAVHTISTPTPELPSFEGRAHASLFIGFSLSLSVAGRAGLQGTAGPEITADLNADNASPCLTAASSIAYHLSAFANVFFKHWDFPLEKGSFAVKPLWKSGNCEPANGAVLATLPRE